MRRVALAVLVSMGVPACRGGDQTGVAVGTLEMVEVDVGPMQPARALRVLVQEGDSVRVGDTLAVFTTPTLSATEAQAVARAAAASALADEVTSGSRPEEVARVQAELRSAEAEAERTAHDLARAEPLAQAGSLSPAQLDALRSGARVAAGRRDAAHEALRLVEEGARRERRAAAQADARGAAAAVAAARAAASDLVLLSPVDGVVSSRNVEPGEVVAAGQGALTVGQPSRPWARIYVGATVLPRLSAGDTLVARLDGDTTVYRGRITAIATKAEFTPRVALSEQERADLLFGVKLEFVDPTGRLRAGVPILVTLP